MLQVLLTRDVHSIGTTVRRGRPEYQRLGG